MNHETPRTQPFLFIGERRSALAIARNWTWEHKRLAGATLHAALEALGMVHGEEYSILNLYGDDGTLDPAALAQIRLCHHAGWHLIALGRVVAAALTHHDIPFVAMIHPAARGHIRRREAYQAHVHSVLAPLIH